MTNLFGKDERHRAVNKAMDGVIAKMEGQGATVVRFELPEYDRLLPIIATDLYEARTVTEKYFAALPPTRRSRATAGWWRQRPPLCRRRWKPNMPLPTA
jgi:Asp-tRNA(Asn)/Glu-tRNA(Gln) amidotransferase A subunit family amidase